MVCPILSLPGASRRGRQVRQVERNKKVIRAFALPPCGALGEATSQGPRSQHRKATSEKSRWQGQLVGERLWVGSVWNGKHPRWGGEAESPAG